MKSFFPQINYKIPTNQLREVFNEVDSRKRGEIGFDDFALLYQKLILDEAVSILYSITLGLFIYLIANHISLVITKHSQ